MGRLWLTALTWCHFLFNPASQLITVFVSYHLCFLSFFFLHAPPYASAQRCEVTKITQLRINGQQQQQAWSRSQRLLFLLPLPKPIALIRERYYQSMRCLSTTAIFFNLDTWFRYIRKANSYCIRIYGRKEEVKGIFLYCYVTNTTSRSVHQRDDPNKR